MTMKTTMGILAGSPFRPFKIGTWLNPAWKIALKFDKDILDTLAKDYEDCRCHWNQW